MKLTFIYALVDPRTRAIRYVGKANDPEYRMRQHFIKDVALNSRKARWLRELVAAGVAPELLIVEECPRDAWRPREIFWISEMRRRGHDLTNTTKGGDGICGHTERTRIAIGLALKGRKLTLDHRAKVSAGLRASPRVVAANNAQRGVRQSAEMIAKRVAGQKASAKFAASCSARKGIPLSPERRDAIRIRAAALKGKKRNPDHVAKSAAGNLGKKRSPQACANISAGNKGRKMSESARLKMIASVTGHKKSPEHRSSLSASMKRSPKAAAARLAITGVPLSDNHRAALSAAYFASPARIAMAASKKGVAKDPAVVRKSAAGRSRPVFQIHPSTGSAVCAYRSGTVAAQFLGVTKGAISNAIRFGGTCCGFNWSRSLDVSTCTNQAKAK